MATPVNAVAYVSYFAVFVANERCEPADGYSSRCVALFRSDELDGALAEAKMLLLDGTHISIECGEMPQVEWDALEEVPDDFHPTRRPAEATT